ncbi:MAG: S9 family peptidase [Acidimicrobiia bacterium]
MRPDQLGDFKVPSDSFLHPDGVQVVFTVTQMNLEEDRYESSIWLFDGSSARRLTSGVGDRSPRWSPDGQTLAFLRKGDGEQDKPQLALLPVAGGEARTVTDCALGVSSIEWSPDGTRILCGVAEYIDGFEDEEERARAPRRITHVSFRFDNVGWTYNVRTHLSVFDVASEEITQLTSGDLNETGASWSPDSNTVVYLTEHPDQRWLYPRNTVATVPAAGGQSEPVTEPGMFGWAGFDPSGTLYVIGVETEVHSLNAAPLQRVSDAGLVRLTDLDRNLAPGHPPGRLAKPRFLADGSMTCVLEDRGMQRVIHISPDGAVTDVVGGPRLITGWDPTGDGTSAAFTATDPTQPGELFWWDGATETQLTDLNDGFAEQAGLVVPEEFTYESDGNEIHGWVLLPEGDEDVPLLFNIHGGPATQYGWGFFDEFQVYVGAGYGVVGVNPRGSSGYGDDHTNVPVGRWAEDVPPDQADLKLAPYAAAEQFPRLDTDRMGIMGGSYGGVSTVLITSMDQSYKSAVAERGVYNWQTMAGTSDIPWFISLYGFDDIPEGYQGLWDASPLARAHKITTPTLVIHSETDYRCHVEQGQQLFTLLYRQGVDTELLLFPAGEGHELSRSGTPKHRAERFDSVLAWHGDRL